MNYLKQINAFYDRMETNPLSANAQSLWHCLMQINNKARWIRSFTVHLSLLCAKTTIAESSLRRARKELQEKGYIRYQVQMGNQATIYELVILYEDVATPTETENERDNPNNEGNKQSEPSQTIVSKAVEYVETHFPHISTEERTDIMEWEKQVGYSAIQKAVDIAIARGKFNWNYAKGILKKWKTSGANQVQMYPRSKNTSNNGKTEVIPPWFVELKKQEKAKNEQQVEQNSEALECRLEKLKAEYFALRDGAG